MGNGKPHTEHCTFSRKTGGLGWGGLPGWKPRPGLGLGLGTGLGLRLREEARFGNLQIAAVKIR